MQFWGNNSQKHKRILGLVFRTSNYEYRVGSGDYTGGVPPVPIPNTEVKTSRADDTWTAGSWESKSLPGKRKRPSIEMVFLLFTKVKTCAWGSMEAVGVPPVRSTLQEYASRDAVWRKWILSVLACFCSFRFGKTVHWTVSYPHFVSRTGQLRPPVNGKIKLTDFVK